jgi:hypothetical protein
MMIMCCQCPYRVKLYDDKLITIWRIYIYQQAVWFEIDLLFWNLPGGLEEKYEKTQNNQLLRNLYRDIVAIQENSMCLISDSEG